MSQLSLLEVKAERPLRQRTCETCGWAELWSCFPGAAICRHPEVKADGYMGTIVIRARCDHWREGPSVVDGGDDRAPVTFDSP